jgi:hypothetical protein
MLGQTPDFGSWHAWVNDAALAAFAVAVCFMVYKIVFHGGRKAVELGERYVSSTEALHDTLREADQQQKVLCQQHADTLVTLNDHFSESLQVQSRSCQHLETLVLAHGPDWAATVNRINDQCDDMQRMKAAAVRACEMCRHIAQAEFPNSAAKVNEHCDEIERLIGEA